MAYRRFCRTNILQAERDFRGCFRDSFYTKSSLDRFGPVFGGGLPNESPSYLVEISRHIAISSTWIVAMGITLLDFAAYDLIDDGEKRVCTDYYINILTALQYGRITVLFYFVPLITMAILYSVIAVTLRRQDKVLRCTAVNGKGQRKKLAIKMTFCLTASFYLCGLLHMLNQMTIKLIACSKLTILNLTCYVQ